MSTSLVALSLALPQLVDVLPGVAELGGARDVAQALLPLPQLPQRRRPVRVAQRQSLVLGRRPPATRPHRRGSVHGSRPIQAENPCYGL